MAYRNHTHKQSDHVYNCLCQREQYEACNASICTGNCTVVRKHSMVSKRQLCGVKVSVLSAQVKGHVIASQEHPV